MVLFKDIFLTGNFSNWTGTFNEAPSPAPSVQNIIVHSGAYAAKLSPATGGHPVYVYKNVTDSTTLFFRFYVYFNALPDTNTYYTELAWIGQGADLPDVTQHGTHARIANVGGTVFWNLRLRDLGANNWDVYSTFSPVINKWYSVELKMFCNAITGEARMYINGLDSADVTGKNTAFLLGVGTVAIYGDSRISPTTNIYYDDVVVDNSYIGQMPAPVFRSVESLGAKRMDQASTIGWPILKRF